MLNLIFIFYSGVTTTVSENKRWRNEMKEGKKRNTEVLRILQQTRMQRHLSAVFWTTRPKYLFFFQPKLDILLTINTLILDANDSKSQA